MAALGYRDSLGTLDPRGTPDLQVCQVTRDPTASRATLGCLDPRDPEDTEDPPDHWDRLESLDLQVLEALRVRWETPGLLGSREMLGSQGGEARGERLVSLATREHKDCRVWRADPGPRVPPALLDHQGTPSLSLRQLYRVVRRSRVFPGPPVPWELPDLQESEEPMVREVQAEEEESRVCLDLLELLAGKDCPADLEILESLASQADREDHSPRMI